MSHSLRRRRPGRDAVGALALGRLEEPTASAIVPPPDTDGWSRGAEPVKEAASSHLGLAVTVIIATAVLAVAMAGLLWLRSGRAHTARQARPAASTTR